MNLSNFCALAVLLAMTGCGSANGGRLGVGGAGNAGGSGGMGGTDVAPPIDQSRHVVSCEYDTLDLHLPIELVVELTKPYSTSGSTEATLSATVTLDEGSVASFLDAGITVIDVISASITSNLTGAVPTTMTASLGSAPINDLDLEEDPDDNGIPGPHRIEFDLTTATSNVASGAREVTYSLPIGGVSLELGDFHIPSDCLGLSLVGVVMTFPVDS